MGKGKGKFSFWFSKIYSGQILFEINKLPYKTAQIALTAASRKISINSKFITLNV
jgi:ribosomal protein L16/L10AE